MTLKEKFQNCTNWHDKATVIEIYHLTQKHVNPRWTVYATGYYFGLMEPTVSEYLKLARGLHDDPKLHEKYPSKEKALIALGSGRYIRVARNKAAKKNNIPDEDDL